MRKLIIEGAEWKWEIATEKLVLRNPSNRKITAPLLQAFPGCVKYDIYGCVMARSAITPGMVADYIKAMIGS